jgi:Mrp family chromosome partitioning ATPase
MFGQEAINVPVLGIIENMAYLPRKNFRKINTIFLAKKVLKTLPKT